jgi:signal transduction histidine kinase
MNNLAKKLNQEMVVPNRRILVCDDEPEIAAGLKRILCPEESKSATMARSSRSRAIQETVRASTDRFEVTLVNTPNEALAAVRKSMLEGRPYAMGFFDVMLGADIDGIELVKQAVAIDPQLYAVFVTAYHDRNVDSIGQILGEKNRDKWDYINKPFSEGEILQKARNVTSLWDLHRLKEWQGERLAELNSLLLQNEKHTAAAAVGRSVAHEFGNLLTHIVGHAELAMNQSDVQTMRNALEIILKAGDTATSVLRRFRRLNDTVEAPSDIKMQDVKSVAEEAFELMEFRLRRHSVDVEKQELPSQVLPISRNSLIQVLVNLFINAMHAMPEGGKLHVSGEIQDEYFVLRIRDSGKGIPEDILPRVTEPLFTTKGSEGTGLGLAICKEIVEIEHGGEFKIENHPAGGAQVSICLPLTEGNENE